MLIYFYARSAKLLSDSGCGCLITQNAWLNTDYGHKFQTFSLGKFSFLKIIDSSAKFFSDVKSQNINAVITVFTKQPFDKFEYSVANAAMNITSRKSIDAKQSLKWGNIISMPQFYVEILAKLSASAATGGIITFGQGLNFPLNRVWEKGSNVPVIVKARQFVAATADGKIRSEVSATRQNKIPALIMPRGIGERHYCTFNLCKAVSYRHVELYMPDQLWGSDLHYCLWAYLNSSFVWLFRETTGRKNLGGGLLKAEATDIKALPINFDFDFATDARKVFASIKDGEPLPVSSEVYTEEHLLIDEMVGNYLGFSDMQEGIREALIEQVNIRASRSRPQENP